MWFARADAQAPLTGRQRAALFGEMNEEGNPHSYMIYVACRFGGSGTDTPLSKGRPDVAVFGQQTTSTYANIKGSFEQLAFLLAFFFPPPVIIDPRAQEAVRTSHSNANTDILLSTWGIIDWMLLHTMGQGIWIAQCNWGLC